MKVYQTPSVKKKTVSKDHTHGTQPSQKAQDSTKIIEMYDKQTATKELPEKVNNKTVE